MTQVPPILAYDDLLQRPGIACERGDGFVRIVTPSLRRWRRLGPLWKISIIALALWAIWPLLFVFVTPSAERLPLLIGSLELCILLVLILIAAMARLSQRFVFEVDRDSFSLTRISFGGRRHTLVYRRDAIRDIHINPHNRHLFIYIIGQDMIEIPLTADAGTAEEAVRALDDAMRRNSESIDRTLPKSLISEHSSPSSDAWRRAMLAISGTLTVLGVALLLAGVPVVWLLLLIVAAIPAGITLGTQHEKFWS